jgi:hypothetical protein
LWLAVDRYGFSLEMLAELFLPVATQ